ncbi:carboxyvinyl-carboxyphosphonate phosphorylmutase, chloroplastic-like [Dioscorea cayenensis subsp. rotundata]|uniref:Carboxyvinyl-carboxyphosphonate phosphorylmutase, chloroplastic-like n=1 Tax=Dioscorea cayennensis subsp. rotundata TaxID=55577 RepID=A0AB40BE55_DIOCR|nr:carboxyvinyl-carboxyphosphonate phosphorylmutase, chloroplastic-like [Dioscorea cayenensis subsp. rotundata]
MTMTMAVALRVPMLPSAGDRRRHCSIGMVPGRRSVVMAEALAGRTSIHRLIESEGTVLLPGCYDALSAAIVQMSGFSAGFISGYALSASLLGKPDFGLLTPPEMAESARLVCAAAPKIPIIADADTGGGNALNVQRTVRDLIAAGAAGCFLEDQAWPKKCGHMRGKQVISAQEHAAKIASARDAIGDADFFLVARTDARATSAKTGLGEAIYRANLYMEAGADACFVEAPRNDAELIEIGRETKGYRVCNMLEGGVTPLHTPQELKAMGFHIIVHPLTTLYASARAMIDILKVIKESGSTRDQLHKLATFEEFNKLIGLDTWFELEAKFAKISTAVDRKA